MRALCVGATRAKTPALRGAKLNNRLLATARARDSQGRVADLAAIRQPICGNCRGRADRCGRAAGGQARPEAL
eukprot:11168004-Lingulodinium_polyedra.AAC.1